LRDEEKGDGRGRRERKERDAERRMGRDMLPKQKLTTPPLEQRTERLCIRPSPNPPIMSQSANFTCQTL